MESESPYDENIPFYFTKREALAKVGKSVRAKLDTQTNSYLQLPIPKGTTGQVIKARVARNTRKHRRWAITVKWNIEFTPSYPGEDVEHDDKTTYFPRRKYEAEIIEDVEHQERAA